MGAGVSVGVGWWSGVEYSGHLWVRNRFQSFGGKDRAGHGSADDEYLIPGN